jgi:enolase
MKIKGLKAREVLDSRGDPTVEVELHIENIKTIASVPSGASVGSNEAVELRDNDPMRYNGSGVLKAIENIKTIILPALKGQEFLRQSDLDKTLIELDGTEHKSKLGANAILAVSIAASKALALEKGLPLYKFISELTEVKRLNMPLGMFNFIEGGKHADNNLPIQEFLVIPQKEKFSENLRAASEGFHRLKKILQSKQIPFAYGHEGGFAPMTDNIQIAIDALSASGQFRIGLDLAGAVINNFPLDKIITMVSIVSLEDPLGETDWQAWADLVKKHSNKILIVGDDLLATNSTLLMKAVEAKAVNAVIIKPNQVGTVTETIKFVDQAKKSNLRTIVSHRSGETEDSFIADFAVGVSADFVKFGAPARGERISKYNRLIRIEEEMTNESG